MESIICSGENGANVKGVINCDSDPFNPWSKGGYIYVPPGDHRKGGQLEWDPKRIMLYSNNSQSPPNYGIEGCVLRRIVNNYVTNFLPLNVNVLDWLLKNRQWIPREFKGKRVYFFGTQYYDTRNQCHMVRCLDLTSAQCESDHNILDCGFSWEDYVAMVTQ